MIQGSLIARTFEDFVVKQGVRLSRSANSQGLSKLIRPLPLHLLDASHTMPLSMENYDLLRILTHMIILYKQVGRLSVREHKRYACDSIIVAYIDFLTKAGKLQLIPLYASHLTRNRRVDCLSQELTYVQDTEERKIILSLMDDYNIEVVDVLSWQLRRILRDPQKQLPDFPTPKLLEKQDNNEANPYRINGTLFKDEISDEHEDLISGLEWLLLMKDNWFASMYYGAECYLYFLRQCHLSTFDYYHMC